jgi:hypothetical protein
MARFLFGFGRQQGMDMKAMSWRVVRLGAIPVLGLAIFLPELSLSGSSRFLSLVAGFLLLADIASLSRGKTRDIFVILASIALGLNIIEAVAIKLQPRTIINVSGGLYSPRPVLGFGPDHSGTYHEERIDLVTGRQIYSANYTIDDNLLRQTISKETGHAIVFFGDSLTFGTGLDDVDTLPQQFADLLYRKIRIVNIAFGGYGPSQFLRILQERLFDSIIGSTPRVFIFLTSAWHAERTACKSRWANSAPRFVLVNEEITLDGTCIKVQNSPIRDWLHTYAAFQLIFEPIFLKPTDNDIELYVQTLVAAVQLARERFGAETIIPYLRNDGYLQNTTSFTDDVVMARLRESGAHVVDVSLQQQESAGAVLGIPGDGHPTALANRLRASLLVDFIRQNLADALEPEFRPPSR